ncbi:MAG: hypothetical protein WCA97_01245 [Terriglobales bacterium]
MSFAKTKLTARIVADGLSPTLRFAELREMPQFENKACALAIEL